MVASVAAHADPNLCVAPVMSPSLPCSRENWSTRTPMPTPALFPKMSVTYWPQSLMGIV